MKRRKLHRWMTAAVGGAWLLQITACLGPDPEFFVASAVSSSIIANVVALVFDALRVGLVGV